MCKHISVLNESRAYPGGSDGGGRSPLGKFDAPQNNDFHLKIRAVFSLMSSEKCHITIFARSHRSERPNRGNEGYQRF